MSCAEDPQEVGWYPVIRFCEDGSRNKAQCKKLYWCGKGWFYDEDCCVPATMNVDTNDSWLSKSPTVM
jgi:hypothetical protein